MVEMYTICFSGCLDAILEYPHYDLMPSSEDNA